MTIEAYRQGTCGDKVCLSRTGGSRISQLDEGDFFFFSYEGKEFIEESYVMIVCSSVKLQYELLFL